MRIFKIVAAIILALAFATSFAFSAFASSQQKSGGDYSAISTITERSSQWMLEQFGHCQTIPELLDEIDRFGCENFVYERLYKMQMIQSFDLDKFIFEDDFHGVCFEFSSFVKCAVLVWKEAHHRDDVQAYVYDVRKSLSWTHSYNFIMEKGHTWYICMTTNNSLVSAGKQSQGVIEILGETPKEYANRHGMHVYNIN